LGHGLHRHYQDALSANMREIQIHTKSAEVARGPAAPEMPRPGLEEAKIVVGERRTEEGKPEEISRMWLGADEIEREERDHARMGRRGIAIMVGCDLDRACSSTSQAQPEPNWVVAAAVNSSTNFS